ncbi:hypothetical protein ACI2OX_07415 [Bacillus sp. N9]
MSWLKRIFSKWNIEDEQEEFHEQRENKHHQQLEMKTKMSYKYPTGQYRFPLIEDRPMRSSERSMKKVSNRKSK